MAEPVSTGSLKSEIEKTIQSYTEKKKNKEKLTRYSEATIRDDFVAPLFNALGWDVRNPDEFDREHIKRAGFADISLNIDCRSGKKPAIFIEVKRFGGIPHVSGRKFRTAIQGREVSSDWTDEERQVLNHASKTVDVKWVILTNFEKFRLFNARTGETIIDIESPHEYVEEENLKDLLHLTKENVVNGTIERLQSRVVREEVDINFLTLLNSWRLELASDLFGKYKGILTIEDIKRIVQRVLDRFIIVRYAEDHWILENPDQLKSLYENWLKTKPNTSLTENLQDYFRGFESHNSKIFEADEKSDEIMGGLDDGVLGGIIFHLYGVSFRKFTSDVLGNTYESYLGNTLMVNDKGTLELKTDYEVQRGQGIYYTPVPVVEYITEKTVGELLKNVELEKISSFRVLDPACGSGSFLIKVFEFLKRYYLEREGELKKGKEPHGNPCTLDSEMGMNLVSHCERKIVRENIYGVDVDEQASSIASVNLILKALKPRENLPLTLYENVKVGDSLLSWLDIDAPLSEHSSELDQIKRMRYLLKRAEKKEERVELERKEAEIRGELNSIYNEKLLHEHFENVDKTDLKPFNWQLEFPEVFDVEIPEEKRGFDVVIGNPPWVSYGLRGVGKLPKQLDHYYRERFPSSAEYKLMTYPLFIDRSISLLRHDGLLGFIVPDSFLLGRYFSKIRRYILDTTRIKEIFLIAADFWPHGTTGRSVILILQKEEDKELRKKNVMCIKCCESLKDLESRTFTMHHYNQEYFEGTSHNRFRLFFSENHKQFADKMQREGKDLKTFARGHTGVRSLTNQADIVSKQAESPAWKRGLTSSGQVGRYWSVYWGDFIHIDPTLLNKGGWDPQVVEHSKLLVRQTGDSLVATFDETGYYHLNNLHSFSSVDDTHDLKYILALLNSKTMNFYYHLTTLEQGRALAQTDIETIEELPIREIDFSKEEEKEIYDEIVKNVDTLLLLHRQRIFLLELFRCLVKKFRQDAQGYEPLSSYYTSKREVTGCTVAERYGIDYLKSIECMDYHKEGEVRSVRVQRKEEFVIIKGGLKGEKKLEEIVKIGFDNEMFENFFFLALETFIQDNYRKRRWSSEKVFEVLDNLEIPLHVRLRSEDAENIKELMGTLKDIYEDKIHSEFMESPVKEFDLTKIHEKITEMDGKIENLVYRLYGLEDHEIELIEEAAGNRGYEP